MSEKYRRRASREEGAEPAKVRRENEGSQLPEGRGLTEVSMHFNRRERRCVRLVPQTIVFSDEGWHQHVGCPKCGCEFGINHAVWMILPWRVVGPEIVGIDSRRPPQAHDRLKHSD